MNVNCSLQVATLIHVFIFAPSFLEDRCQILHTTGHIVVHVGNELGLYCTEANGTFTHRDGKISIVFIYIAYTLSEKKRHWCSTL